MAYGDIYQRQIGPGGEPQLGGASPDAFGAAIGAAIEHAGQEVDDVAVRAHRIETEQARMAKHAGFAADFPDAYAQNKAFGLDRRRASPDTAISDQLADFDERVERIMPTDPKVAQAVQGQVAEARARIAEEGDLWQRGRVAAVRTTGAQTMKDHWSYLAAMNPDDHALYEQGKSAIADFWHAQTDLAPEQQTAAYNEGVGAMLRGRINAATKNGDIGLARQLLAGADAGRSFGGDDVTQLRGTIEAEQRHLDEVARHGAELQKQAVTEAREMVSRRLASGEVVPDAEMETIQRQLVAVGEHPAAYDIGVEREKANINRATQAWLPAQYQAAIDHLMALGDKRTPQQGRQLKQLEAIASSRIDAFNRDPGSWAALNGDPRPQLDLADPQAVAATVAWRDRVQAKAGRAPSLLSDDQLRDLRQSAEGSPADRLQVANAIAAFPVLDAQRAAKQIAPTDPLLARLTAIAPEDRPAAVNGAAARKAHPKLVDEQAGRDARDDFDRLLGGAAALLDQGDRGAAFELARNMFADWAVRHGKQDYDKDAFLRFAQRTTGGVGDWGGAPVMLQPGLSQKGVEAALSGMGWKTDDAHAPTWATGRAMTPAEVRRFTPMLRPDGQYEFHGRDGTVIHARNGGVWMLDIARMAKRRGL